MRSGDELAPETVEAILERMGLAARPSPDLCGLSEVYAAWCRRVPFDNVRKRIHVEADDPGPFPGDTPADFFAAWLRHGAGGTCWAGNGALHALLDALGFAAERGIATMSAAPDVPPNHGTVRVTIDDRRFLVDASILHGAPLELGDEPGGVPHPAWGIWSRRLADGRLLVTWPSLHRPEGFDCRFERFGAPATEFSERYEASRTASLFNDTLYLRLNTDRTVVGAMDGRRIEIAAVDDVDDRALGGDERLRFLVEEIGLSEEIARRLPPDRPRTQSSP